MARGDTRRLTPAMEDGNAVGEIMQGKTGVSAPMPQRAVRRDRLLREMRLQAQEACATILIAPDGFGKTTLLSQRMAEIQADPERGVARMVDAVGMDGGELYGLLGGLEAHLEPRMRPLIAIDNLPVLDGAALDGVIQRLRELHDKGFEFVVACRPNNHAFAHRMGDACKLGAQALAIRPKEYSDWARMLAISEELDVYGLTQGIPSLVAMLGMVDGRQPGIELFSSAVAALYGGILDDLRHDRDALYRTACLLLLTGTGSMRDFERVKMRMRMQGWTRLVREYPVFGIDIERGTYRCLGRSGKAMGDLCRRIARMRPLFAARAIRILMVRGDVDRAVRVAGMLERPEDALGVLGEYPAAFALSGNISFVRDMMGSAGDISSSATSAGSVLAMHLAALASGELRLARALASELKRRARDIPHQIDPESWAEARAFSAIWMSCRGVDLPKMDSSFTQGHKTAAAESLELHVRVYAELIGGAGAVKLDGGVRGIDELAGDGLSIPQILLACDRALIDAMCGDMGDTRAVDAIMQRMVRRLLERHLVPIATSVRMVAATCRLLASLPVADERAFVDAGTLSVRTSDFATQLFCLVGEGWQALGVGQHTNALFRAHQALKLATEEQGVIIAWARMLECCAHLLNTPRMALDEEAGLLDLSQGAPGAVDAWITALKLAAARRLSELSAWCSLNKEILLSRGFTAFARQAIAALGDKASALRRVIPAAYMGDAPGLVVEEGARTSGSPGVMLHDADMLLGQVNVSLFGGFQVERGGHVVTDAVWRRRKACVIAARLVLANGAFVGRKELGEEVWPDKDYLHAREALYAGLTSLRAAFGQSADGPQYVLTQGEGIAVNTEYVVSDTMRFEVLARDILLRRTGTTGRQLINACLQLEELYTGPLYVPNFGDAAYYVRQRRIYQTKFIDCMMRGIAASLELDDVPVASWLIEAALRQAPLREDVIRAAMRIYDMSGRRREVVELYNSHMHVLERELHALPEKETQMAYEAIIQRGGTEALLA